MDKNKLMIGMNGTLTVKAQDVANLAVIAHEMRARFTDPRMRGCTRIIFKDTIQAVDSLIDNAGKEE